METNTWINVLKWVRGAGISLLRGRRIPWDSSSITPIRVPVQWGYYADPRKCYMSPSSSAYGFPISHKLENLFVV
jgi:hypothetical protein